MNEQLRAPALPAATQAAEGLPRRRFTVAEIEAMVAGGIIAEDERIELIGGEVVPMSPKGNRHELVKAALQQYWFPRIVGTANSLITETTLYVAKDEFLEPDFLFWPRTIALSDVKAGSALLIVEVADTSLGYDLGRKAGIYAGLGLAELWVVDANALATWTHSRPGPGGYAEVREIGPADLLTPIRLPQLAVRMAALAVS